MCFRLLDAVLAAPMQTTFDFRGFVSLNGVWPRELDMMVVFPGLSCDMVSVVACIGSEGLLGTGALQLCLLYQLDLRTGQL